MCFCLEIESLELLLASPQPKRSLLDVQMEEESDYEEYDIDSRTLANFATWPAWQREQHLAHCCEICSNLYSWEKVCGECDNCGKRLCFDCQKKCADCFGYPPLAGCKCDLDDEDDPWGGCSCPQFQYCEDCHHGRLHVMHCGKLVCGRHLKFHDDTAAACEESDRRRGSSCSECILHHRNVRDTLVREVERNILLGAKGRAMPAKDAPMATVVLHRLVRSGQEPMASIVLDFVGGRREGPRRKAKLRAKLRARKDTRGKVPRKQLAKGYLMRQRVIEGRL